MSRRRAAARRAARGEVEQDPGIAAAERAIGRIAQGGPFAGPPLSRQRFREGERETRRRATKPTREARAEESRTKAKAARKARRKGRGR